jgi:hypothetical protein
MKIDLMSSAALPQQQRSYSQHRMMPQQQQREGDPAPAAVDYGAVYKTLTPENQAVYANRGFDKGGKDGGPADVNALFDTIRNQDSLIGKNNLAPPDMTQEDPFKIWEGGRKALGILDKPEEYKLTRKEMPKGADGQPIKFDEEAEKVFRDAIAGVVPAKYADKLFGKFQDMNIARATAFHQQLIEDKNTTDLAITKNWGAEKDTKIARATVIADRIAEQLGLDPSEAKTAANSMMGSWPMLKMFDFLATQFGEGFIKDGGGGGDANNENTPAGAKAAIARLDGDSEFTKQRNDAGHANHKAAVARYAKLSEIAAGAK